MNKKTRAQLKEHRTILEEMSRRFKVVREPPPFTIDCYYAEDGTPVVHIETHGMPENARGPICRIYLNDGLPALYANPHFKRSKR